MANIKHFEATVQLDSGLIVPTSAALGAVLVSDAEGHATWTTSGTVRKFIREPELTTVQVVSRTNQASLEGLPTIDGITLEDEQQVLLTGQTTKSQNGPWVVHAGAWTRPTDFASGWEVKAARNVIVLKGTLGARTVWLLDYTAPVIIDTTAHTWVVMPQMGSIVQKFEWKEAFGTARELHPYKNCLVTSTVEELATSSGEVTIVLTEPEETLINIKVKLTAGEIVDVPSVIIPAGRKYKVNLNTTQFKGVKSVEYV